jgi:hypothetical protein
MIFRTVPASPSRNSQATVSADEVDMNAGSEPPAAHHCADVTPSQCSSDQAIPTSAAMHVGAATWTVLILGHWFVESLRELEFALTHTTPDCGKREHIALLVDRAEEA